MKDRMAQAERDLMVAEYLLDSTVTHVHKIGCIDIKPRALKRIDTALAKVRVARQRIRAEQGHSQRTLVFDGALKTAGKKDYGIRGIHKWRKDCEDGPAAAPED